MSVCWVIGCRNRATGEKVLEGVLRPVCTDHGGPPGSSSGGAVAWDGPAVAVAVSAAAVAVGVLLLPWLSLSYRGADQARSLWWLLGDVDTDGLSTVDDLMLTTGAPWLQVLGAVAVAAGLAWLVKERKDPRDVAVICLVAAGVSGYIAWLFNDAAEDTTAIVGVAGARAELGAGGYVTVAGFVAGALAAWWMSVEDSH